MKIAIRRGHQYTGADGAALGYVNEIDVAERYYKLVIQKLQALGHQVLDVTPPEANRTLADSLNYGIRMANNWGADLFISCHVDAYLTDQARGCEVVCGSQNGIVIGQRIVNELVNLGFPVHRGAYIDDRGLAEIRETNMVACIVEPFFCDDKLDVDIYNKVGDEGISNAIVKAITGQTVNPQPNPQPQPTPKPTNNKVLAFQHLCNQLGIKDMNGRSLTEDGILGTCTQSVYSKMPVLKVGSKGLAVSFVQSVVGASPVDGDFGNVTKFCVINYQNKNRLQADGIVGQNTWKALVEK